MQNQLGNIINYKIINIIIIFPPPPTLDSTKTTHIQEVAGDQIQRAGQAVLGAAAWTKLN